MPEQTPEQEELQTQDTSKIAPGPEGDNAGSGAPNAVPQSSIDAVEKIINQALGDKPTEEQTSRVRQVMGDAGATVKPETVNGVSVVGKKLSEDGQSWVPDTEEAAGRSQDIFDRIGIASPHEGVRQVLEEMARFIGMTSENTAQLPDGMPLIKSTPSIRKDVGATSPERAPIGGASQTPSGSTPGQVVEQEGKAADSSGETETSPQAVAGKKASRKSAAKAGQAPATDFVTSPSTSTPTTEVMGAGSTGSQTGEGTSGTAPSQV